MNSERQVIDAHQKALDINLDPRQYGTIAEIGAGQETARWFFRVGGAAGTIAKAMSAYDMKFSDAIYGPSPRYVSRERLRAMLEHEYHLLVERLDTHRGGETTFFSFANTVAARSYSRKEDGQGWLGIRFQTAPRGEPSQIDLHVHLRGAKSIQDQETLGGLGVNLIYGALYHHADPVQLMSSLLDGLYPELLEIDMIEFSGPAFAGVDNRLMALRLVQKGLAPSAMFTADGRVVHPAEALYKKAVLIERSRFRPPTHLNMNMLDCARAQFIAEREVQEREVLVLSEMTLNNLMDGGDIEVRDFLHRTEILCALGKNVMISNVGEYYRLAAYLFRYTQRPMGVVMGIPTLREVFDEKYYGDLAGGILESFGRLFKYDLRLYVGPCLGEDRQSLVTVGNFQPPAHLQHLYAYLHANGFIKELQGVRPELLTIFSHDILAKIRAGQSDWEDGVPPRVAQMIRDKHLFGCGGHC
ncbi:MAG: TonB-dependent receptor [Gammaproteobacteria bacterium]